MEQSVSCVWSIGRVFSAGRIDVIIISFQSVVVWRRCILCLRFRYKPRCIHQWANV